MESYRAPYILHVLEGVDFAGGDIWLPNYYY